MSDAKKVSVFPAKLAIGMLVVTLLPWQYGIYMVGKVVVFAVAAYYLAKGVGKDDDAIKWPLIIVAILYNPLLPVYLYAQGLWIMADIVAIWIFWRTLKHIQ